MRLSEFALHANLVDVLASARNSDHSDQHRHRSFDGKSQRRGHVRSCGKGVGGFLGGPFENHHFFIEGLRGRRFSTTYGVPRSASNRLAARQNR